MHSSFPSSRRHFIKVGLLSCAGVLSSAPAYASLARLTQKRSLSFRNLHTDEKLKIVYWSNGTYNEAAWGKINHILRDHYSNDTHRIAPALMDLLFSLQGKLHGSDEIEVISGYRSPATNLRLAALSDGVAKNSYHLKGMAIDIRIPGNSLAHIEKTALGMQRGGVGFYPASDFVHVDVGPVRQW